MRDDEIGRLVAARVAEMSDLIVENVGRAMKEDGERIAVLEANQRHIEAKVDVMAKQVNEVHELLLQARGAKWAIIGVASLAGFLSGKIGSVLTAMGFKMP